MTDSMIRTKEIRKSFGTLEVLKGIDLLVERGEVVSISYNRKTARHTLHKSHNQK